DQWIYFLKNEEIKEEFNAQGLTQAKRELDILKLPELERAAYERYQDDLHYQASMVESSYTVGTIDGKKEGLAQGLEQGIEQGKKEIAREMLKTIDVQTISVITGLTEAEILALKEDRTPE
ncbi:MAG: hypothetical protein B6I36_05380, partial [Desulfobacteraceae bacterium 4572_35.1]